MEHWNQTDARICIGKILLIVWIRIIWIFPNKMIPLYYENNYFYEVLI